MKQSIAVLLVSFITSITLAETATITVEGMHCGGCKKMVTKAVCNDKKIAEDVAECKVSLDEKTKIGTVILKSKDTKTINISLVETAIQSAGEDYKISKKEITK